MSVTWEAKDLGSDPCCAVHGLPGLGQVTCFTMADLSFPGFPGIFSSPFQLQTLFLSVGSLLTRVQEWAVGDTCTQTLRAPYCVKGHGRASPRPAARARGRGGRWAPDTAAPLRSYFSRPFLLSCIPAPKSLSTKRLLQSPKKRPHSKVLGVFLA